MANEQIMLPQTDQINRVNTNGGLPLSVTENKDQLSISNDKVGVKFDRKTGQLISWKVKGMEFILDGNGPRPNFWRAPTDNDFGNKMQNRNLAWKKASLELWPEDIKVIKRKSPNNRICS